MSSVIVIYAGGNAATVFLLGGYYFQSLLKLRVGSLIGKFYALCLLCRKLDDIIGLNSYITEIFRFGRDDICR